MAREKVELGCAPWGEECAQVGSPGYAVRARAECNALREQIRRENPGLPEGVSLVVKSFSHDFGCYYELVAVYDEADAQAAEAAWELERKGPERWDAQAVAELAAYLCDSDC